MEKHLYQEHFDLETKHWWFIAKKKILMSVIRQFLPAKKSPLRILDAGCGTGLMLGELSRVGDVSGMDFSPDAIQFCSIKYGDRVRQGWLPDNIPFGGQTFDMIICLDVIEHIKDDVASVKALKDALNPGGTLVLTVPALMLLWSNWDVLNQHQRRYNKKNLLEVFEKSGLQVQRATYFNSLLFLPVLAIRLLNNMMKKESMKSDTDMPSPLVNAILLKTFSFEKLLLKIMNFPIGVSLLVVATKPNDNSKKET